jgi:hypothetical protein
MSPTTAAAQSDQRGRTIAASLQQDIEDRVERLPVLELLAIGQNDLGDINPCPAQRVCQALQVKWCNGCVGDDRRLRPPQERQQQVGTLQQGRPNVNRIRSIPECDVQRFMALPVP